MKEQIIGKRRLDYPVMQNEFEESQVTSLNVRDELKRKCIAAFYVVIKFKYRRDFSCCLVLVSGGRSRGPAIILLI